MVTGCAMNGERGQLRFQRVNWSRQFSPHFSHIAISPFPWPVPTTQEIPCLFRLARVIGERHPRCQSTFSSPGSSGCSSTRDPHQQEKLSDMGC